MFDQFFVSSSKYDIDDSNVYLIELLEVLERLYKKAVFCKSDMRDNGLQVGILSSLYSIIYLLTSIPKGERPQSALYVIERLFDIMGLESCLDGCVNTVIDFVSSDFSSDMKPEDLLTTLNEKVGFADLPVAVQSAAIAYCVLYMDTLRRAYDKLLKEFPEERGNESCD